MFSLFTMSNMFTTWQASFDERLCAAVRKALGTNSVYLDCHRPTGIGSQTVPVFDVPKQFRDAAKALGLELVEDSK